MHLTGHNGTDKVHLNGMNPCLNCVQRIELPYNDQLLEVSQGVLFNF